MDNGKNTSVKNKETITACHPRPNGRGLLGGELKTITENKVSLEKEAKTNTPEPDAFSKDLQNRLGNGRGGRGR